MRVPNEHPILAIREWIKTLAPLAALIAASAAAIVAWKQLDLAKQSNEMQNRAYVLAKSQSIKIELGLPAEVTTLFVNYGKTPAHNFILTTTCMTAPTTDLPALLERKPTSGESLGVLAPNNDYDNVVSCGDELTAEIISGLNDGKWSIVVEGELTYSDVFTKRRTTTFRAQVGGRWGTKGTQMYVEREKAD